jgi:uncharacterized protein YcbX
MMQTTPRLSLAHLHTTPVKGTRLHSPTEVLITRDGILDDRRFYIIDGRGRLTNGRRHGPLVQIVTHLDHVSGELSFRFPDGSVVAASATVRSEAVSTLFFDHYVDGHVIEGPWNAALSDFAGQPLRLIEADHPGRGLDLHPITVVSSSSIDGLRQQDPTAEAIDRRRFRTSLELAGALPLEEEGWAGRQLAIGDVVLEMFEPVPRCRVTRQDPETGTPDVDTLRILVRSRGLLSESDGSAETGNDVNFAMYALVARPGTVRTGQEVRLIPS